MLVSTWVFIWISPDPGIATDENALAAFLGVKRGMLSTVAPRTVPVESLQWELDAHIVANSTPIISTKAAVIKMYEILKKSELRNMNTSWKMLKMTGKTKFDTAIQNNPFSLEIYEPKRGKYVKVHPKKTGYVLTPIVVRTLHPLTSVKPCLKASDE